MKICRFILEILFYFALGAGVCATAATSVIGEPKSRVVE